MEPNLSRDEQLRRENPEFTMSLGIIVSAFVDIGFGASATQQAQRAANDNRQLRALVEEFHRIAA